MASVTAMASKRFHKESSCLCRSVFLSCFVAFLCIASLLVLLTLLFTSSRPSVIDDRLDKPPARNVDRRSCNYSDGSWVRDQEPVAARYDHTCKEIFKGWNCIANQKPNGRDLLRWRWQPSRCCLPRLDPLGFLRRFRDTNIGFIGDSLNRNMFVSLVCTLREYPVHKYTGCRRGNARTTSMIGDRQIGHFPLLHCS